MWKSNLARSFILILAVTTTACARNGSRMIAGVAELTPTEQNQAPASAVQSLTTVEGADLKARLEAASKRAGRQTPYWSAYSFDVRPGVAVDPTLHEFHGSMNTIGETSIFIGTTASGMTVETRNLAVFVLRDPGNNQVSRMEVYNLETKREYGGYPVYWLGRA